MQLILLKEKKGHLMNSEQPFNQQPIFLLGISGRSGTNFFHRALALHPDCHRATKRYIHEDHFLHYADPLFEYVEKLCQRWARNKNKSPNPDAKKALLKSIGEGLVSYLHQQTAGKPILTKTPSVRNLPYFFELFPNARLLILMRDGRAVVESSVKSFGLSYEKAIEVWVTGARTILAFDQEHKEMGLNYRLVKYEDLVTNPASEMRRVLTFLELDPALYDFTAPARLPIFFSSKFMNGSWKRSVVDKTPDFKPLERWRNWDIAMHERFNRAAGKEMEALGYEIS